jgi:Protein of unknown function (DUF2510)
MQETAPGGAESAPQTPTDSLNTPPAPPPAGWYSNPQGLGQRYWDGQQWTEHYQGVPAPAQGATSTAPRRPASFWLALVGLAGMAIGAFGPWITALGGAISVSGTSDGRDGWLVLAAALIAGALFATYASRGLTGRLTGVAVFAVLSGIVCVYDLVDISNHTETFAGVSVVSPGWGIYLALAGSITLTVSALLVRQQAGAAR